MKANHDVTDALRRTVGLMQSELERSVLSVQMLGLSCSMRTRHLLLTSRVTSTTCRIVDCRAQIRLEYARCAEHAHGHFKAAHHGAREVGLA